MQEKIIKRNDAGQRLDKFLTKSFSSLPQSLMYKYIRLKRIKVNGKRAEISTRLNEGDVVSLYINDEFMTPKKKKYEFTSSPDKINIVYEDENILLVDKPHGLIVHPDKTEFRDTLIYRIQHYLYNKGKYDPSDEMSFCPALVNRIDRNTAGIVIAAKNAESLRILNEKMKNRELKKFYQCVVHGYMGKREDTLSGFLQKNQDKNKVFISDKRRADSRSICTRYKVLAEKNNLSLLEVELLTGRTHQIRAHLASIGHPLLGDGKYGKNANDKRLGFKHQALYSYKLVFDFKTDGGLLNYLNGRAFTIKNIWFADQLFN